MLEIFLTMFCSFLVFYVILKVNNLSDKLDCYQDKQTTSLNIIQRNLIKFHSKEEVEMIFEKYLDGLKTYQGLVLSKLDFLQQDVEKSTKSKDERLKSMRIAFGGKEDE